LRDAQLAAALDGHAARVADPALGEAAGAVLESTGEPGAGAAAAGTMMHLGLELRREVLGPQLLHLEEAGDGEHDQRQGSAT